MLSTFKIVMFQYVQKEKKFVIMDLVYPKPIVPLQQRKKKSNTLFSVSQQKLQIAH